MKKKHFFDSERSWVLVFAVCLVLLTAIPYLIAASQRGGDFTGFLIGVEDGNSYIAKMLQGAQGDWLFRSPYTTTSQTGALIYLPYLLLGKLLGPNAQHDALVLLFHLFRSATVILLCFAAYDFLSHFLKSVNLRRLGLALITLGCGLGWLLLFLGLRSLFGSIPLDFYSPEAFGFLAIFSLPHLVLARALFLWGLLRYLRTYSNPVKKVQRFTILLTIFIWLAMALIHLITAALGLLLIAVHFGYSFIRKYLNKNEFELNNTQLQTVIWALVGVLPVIAYNAWVYWQDSYLRAWATQNQILSPNPIHYLVGYGLVLPFAYFGLRNLLRVNWQLGTFLLSWMILLPFLLYAPMGLQRRLSEGVWVALVLLALYAFEPATRRVKNKLSPIRNPRELWLFSLAFPSTLILLLGSWQAAQNVELPVFRSDTETHAFVELGLIAQPGDVVLGSYQTSNALPAWAPLRVVAGHGPESVDLEHLLPKIQSVYQGRTSEDTRLEFLQKYGVKYIFWGPIESSLGSWEPTGEPYLDLVVNLGEYRIYRVSEEEVN